jgi:hypothetical protein
MAKALPMPEGNALPKLKTPFSRPRHLRREPAARGLGLMSDTTNATRNGNFNIWQQNMNKSRVCQHDLISSAKLARKGIDIVALQEPAINNFGNTIASREWIMVYPTMHGSEPLKTHSLMLVRSNILTKNWKQVDFPSGDVTIVWPSGPWGELTIYNIYNDCDNNDTVHQVEAFNHSQESAPRQEATNANARHVIWLGDFN